MKTFIVTSLLLFLLPSWGFSRLEKGMTYQEMESQADLVVIAKPTSTKEMTEGEEVLGGTWKVIGLSTKFSVHAILKGDKDLKSFVLHHYRINGDSKALINGPNFVHFDPKARYCFLLFLRKEPDGRYAPVAGQIDPAITSIITLKDGPPE